MANIHIKSLVSNMNFPSTIFTNLFTILSCIIMIVIYTSYKYFLKPGALQCRGRGDVRQMALGPIWTTPLWLLSKMSSSNKAILKRGPHFWVRGKRPYKLGLSWRVLKNLRGQSTCHSAGRGGKGSGEPNKKWDFYMRYPIIALF